MAYEEQQAVRIRRQLQNSPVEERQKMGGLSFLCQGRVVVRLEGSSLVVRCPPEQTDQWLRPPTVSRYAMRGKPNLEGWLVVRPEGWQTDAQLAQWLVIAQQYIGHTP